MSDNQYVPQNSDSSHQDDLHTVQTTGFGRRRMVTALLHGQSRSGSDHPRRWPFAVTGILATGLVAAGIGIADAYQDQKANDRGSVVPPVIVQVPEPSEATTEPTSEPSAPATKQPKSPPAKKTAPKAKPKQQQTKRPTKPKTTKPSTTKKSSSGTRSPKKTATKSSGTKQQRSGGQRSAPKNSARR